MDEILRSPYLKDRTGALRNSSIPVDTIKKVHRYTMIRNDKEKIAIAQNSSTPEEILRELKEYADRYKIIEIIKGLAKNSSTPIDILEELKKYVDNVISEGLTLELGEDNDDLIVIIGSLASNEATPGYILEEFVKIKKIITEGFKNGNKSIHRNRQEEFIENASLFIRGQIAGNKSTSVEVLERLYKESKETKEFQIQKGLANNLSTPVNLLRRMLKESEDIGVTKLLLKNPAIPVEDLIGFVNCEDEVMKKNAIYNEAMTVEILQQVLNDKGSDKIIERAIDIKKASDPQTEVSVLYELAMKDKELAKYVAKNASAPMELLRILVDKDEIDITRSILENPIMQIQEKEEVIGEIKEMIGREQSLDKEIMQEKNRGGRE